MMKIHVTEEMRAHVEFVLRRYLAECEELLKDRRLQSFEHQRTIRSQRAVTEHNYFGVQ